MRRSIKEYVKGLKQQVATEQVKLDEMRTTRDTVIFQKAKELARMDAEIAAQAAKVEALQGVVTQMSPATKLPKKAGA